MEYIFFLEHEDSDELIECVSCNSEQLCQTFAALPFKSDVTGNHISGKVLLLEVIPQDKHYRRQFFVSKRFKEHDDIIVREFETKEVRPQGGTWEGTEYDRGFYDSEDILTTHIVELNGRLKICIWLSNYAWDLLHNAEKVVVHSFARSRVKTTAKISAFGTGVSAELQNEE